MEEQRASDADRERAAEQLRRAGGDGRLTLDELDERLGDAYAARTRPDLQRLLADVDEEHTPVIARPATGSGLAVRPGPGGSRWVVAIMSGAARAGRWRLAERVTVVSLMGGADLDLNEAELAAEETTITVWSVMGGSDVRIPEGVRVEVSDVGIMGGNDVRRGDPGREPAAGPVVRLRLISIMGGATVRRGPRRTKLERRTERKLDGERRRHLGH